MEAVGYITSRARERSEKILIDTSGYVYGYEAVRLKLDKIGLIRPDLIVALQRGDELEPILREVEKEDYGVLRISVSDSLPKKSIAERTRFRKESFERYFAGAKDVRIDKKLLERWDDPEEELKDKIVCFRDHAERDVALGLVIEEMRNKLLVRSPIPDIQDISWVIVGKARVQLEKN